MDKTIFKASEIRYLWKHRGSKNYELKCLKATGNLITSIIFEDIRNGREVSGKLVASPREGEAYHWPRLQHENLAPLFDVVSINEKVSVYLSVILEKNLRDIIHEDEFLQAPNCFERKKSYAEDVLWGLDYLHDKGLCLMNLNDANVFIYNQTDKALISDFSCLTLAARASKDNVAVPSLYRAPELNNSSNCFNGVAAEMWACGVMMLQIFTGHAMPETCSTDELLQRVANLHNSVLAEANRGSFITSNAFISFQSFLSSFLCLEPSERWTSKIAAVSSFLQTSWSKTDRRYGKLWQFYVPPIYSPEGESESQNFCNPPKMLSCPNSREIDSYRDNLKIYFPWNKFINLNYVSNDLNNSKSHNSSKLDKQIGQNNINKETVDVQINKTHSLNLVNALSDHCISKSNENANQKFENINCVIETTRNNFHLETDTNTNELKNATHFSSLVSSNVSDPSKNNSTKEISSPESKHTEMKNQEAVIGDTYLMNLTAIESCNELQDSDLEENKLFSPLKHSTDELIGMLQKETNEIRNEESNRKNECPSNFTLVSKNISNEYIVEATNKLSSVPSFSTGDSIAAPRNETTWDKREIYCNLLPEILKSDTDSDKSSQMNEPDFVIKSTNPQEHNQNSLPDAEQFFRAEDNSLLQLRINKTPFYNFYKNRIRGIQKSHSDSTINSSISHSISVKNDSSNLSYRTWNSHIALFPEARKGGLIISEEKGFERICFAMNSSKSINEEARTECSTISEERSSFSRAESELSDSLQKDNSEIKNSRGEDTYSSLNQGLLLSATSLTCQPAFPANNQVWLSSMSNKSEICLEERKPLLCTKYMSEMCLDVRKRAAISQNESLNKNTTFYNDGTIKFDPELFDIEKSLRNATTKIGYTLGSDNTDSLDAEVDIFKCYKKSSYGYALMERSDSKAECGNIEYFPYEGISIPDKITEKQPIRLDSLLPKFQDKEMFKVGTQPTEFALLKSEDVDSEKANESSLENLPVDKDEEINEMQAKSYSFTEISLNSTQEPDIKSQQNKSKKKEKRRKSWFHRLCPGCKVYHDDKEELFAGT